MYRAHRNFLFIAAFALSGCGSSDQPPLGYVAGKVSYNGAGVADINVLMKPEVGRTAYARTNSDGEFEIEYTDGEAGTKAGPNVVSLEWPQGTVDPPFYLSDKYSAAKSTLKIDVKEGQNPNFDIEIEPDPEGEKEAAKKPKFVVD